ncbi:MAG TPA: thiamine biosynthesis protein ThiS [Gammaproteobacteria bacterium]|nr:thiamine biosynthesis protein ThiS [Gammaproteobacteria bacterium]
MEIELNGEKMQVPTEISAAGLIDHLKLADKRLALEVNQEIVPRSQYAEVMIKDNDTVEIVHAIGGG